MALPVRIKIAPENEAHVDFFSPFGDWFSFFDLDHDLTRNMQNAIMFRMRFIAVGATALDRGMCVRLTVPGQPVTGQWRR